MIRSHYVLLIAVLAAVVVPSAAFAGGAGDDQYLDPLEGLTGSGGTTTTTKPKNSNSGPSSSTPSVPTSGTPAVAPVVTETPSAKDKPKATKLAPIKRRSIDVDGLSGIGSLVAVPVEHVTLVIGDIAHGRG
jgi:hypothetical protein